MHGGDDDDDNDDGDGGGGGDDADKFRDSVTRMRAEQRRNLGPISGGASQEASTRLMVPACFCVMGIGGFFPGGKTAMA